MRSVLFVVPRGIAALAALFAALLSSEYLGAARAQDALREVVESELLRTGDLDDVVERHADGDMGELRRDVGGRDGLDVDRGDSNHVGVRSGLRDLDGRLEELGGTGD